MGVAPMLVLTVGVLAEPPEIGRAIAAVPLLMAAVYLPAVWGSVAKTQRRRQILRVSTIASLVLAFAGGFLIGLEALVALIPATGLLWLAAGGRNWGR